MTRKDYVLIANALKAAKFSDNPAELSTHIGTRRSIEQWNECVEEIADALEIENPRFDRNIFLAACGMN